MTWTPLGVAWDAWRASRGGPAALAARQQARLASLVAYARTRSRFFAAHYRGLPDPLTDPRLLPPVTRPELMARFDDWVTDPAITRAAVEAFLADPARIGQPFQGRYFVCSTSGVTGDPGRFVHDRAALLVYDALVVMRGYPAWIGPARLWDILRRGARLAGVVATGGHFAGVSAWERLRQHPLLSGRLATFSVLTPLPNLVDALNAFQPAVLFSYPTALELLAGEQARGRLAIRPALVLFSGEGLPPSARDEVEAAFRCPVRGIYGASEFLYLAFECDQRSLHLNADWVILEPVDAAYRPVPAGEPSATVLVSNLANRVQPILRYDLGDRVTLCPGPCACGSALPALRVEGRSDEVLAFATPSGATVRLVPLALGTVVEQTPGVERFQLLQTGPAVLRLRLAVAAGAEGEAVWAAAEQRLRAYLASQGLAGVRLERASEPPGRDPRSGKFRQVWAELEPAREPRGPGGPVERTPP